MDTKDELSRRKGEHLEVAVSDAIEQGRSAGWDDVALIHRSLPKASLSKITTTTTFLGYELQAPVMIASMTGGHPAATVINERLGKVAARLGLAVGVGSQRAALSDSSLEVTYKAVRAAAPSALVIANLGICQLVSQSGLLPFTVKEVRQAVDMVQAQAFALHLNTIEELIQTEGDRNMTGLFDALQKLTKASPVPIIAKETGGGVCRETAYELVEAGVEAIDVGGAGGTSFARVESVRAQRRGDSRGAQLARTFDDWGIPTAVSLLDCRNVAIPLIATGGVRNGLHVAKALALGAHLVGIGRPALKAALRSVDELQRELELMIEELKVAILLAGATRSSELAKCPYVLSGSLLEWLKQRTYES